MDAFTADTLIRDVLLAHPEAADVFEAHGLACPSCLAAGMESISAVATMHDVSISALLAELNKLTTRPAEED
jgi:hybrid cluster-associated redox disulfide protein